MARGLNHIYGTNLQVIAVVELPEPRSWFKTEVFDKSWPVVLGFASALLTITVAVSLFNSFKGK